MVKAREYIAPCYAKAKKLQFHYENNKEKFNNKKLYEGKKGKSYTRNSKQAKNSIALCSKETKHFVNNPTKTLRTTSFFF